MPSASLQLVSGLSSGTDAEPLEPLGRLLATVGLNPSAATIWRWVQKGRRGVKLRVVRMGRLMSKRTWVDTFVSSLTVNADEATMETPRAVAARHKRNLAALNED